VEQPRVFYASATVRELVRYSTSQKQPQLTSCGAPPRQVWRRTRPRQYATDDAIATISRHYFGGAEVLFPDTRDTLTGGIANAEDLVQSFNRLVAADLDAQAGVEGAQQPPTTRIDLAWLRSTSQTQRELAQRFLVDHARATTLDDLGQRHVATAILSRYIVGDATE